MKRIPNSVVSELIRLVPILIANILPGQSTRVDNAIRLTKKIINERRADLANVAIQKADLEQSLAEIRADYKGKIKPLEERIVKLRDELKAGGDWIKGDCFKFVDEEEKMVGFYSPEGYLLEQRPMTQDERQRNVFRAIRADKTGTDD